MKSHKSWTRRAPQPPACRANASNHAGSLDHCHADAGAPRSMVLTGAAGLYKRMAKRMCSLKFGATSPATDRNTARSEAPAVATRHLSAQGLACQGVGHAQGSGQVHDIGCYAWHRLCRSIAKGQKHCLWSSSPRTPQAAAHWKAASCVSRVVLLGTAPMKQRQMTDAVLHCMAHHLTAEPGIAKSALRALPPCIAASTAHVTHEDSRLALTTLQTT